MVKGGAQIGHNISEWPPSSKKLTTSLVVNLGLMSVTA